MKRVCVALTVLAALPAAGEESRKAAEKAAFKSIWDSLLSPGSPLGIALLVLFAASVAGVLVWQVRKGLRETEGRGKNGGER